MYFSISISKYQYAGLTANFTGTNNNWNNNGMQVQKQDISSTGAVVSTIFAKNLYDVVGVAKSSSSNNNGVCKEPSGQFADPKYCDKYYDCWEGRPVSSAHCSHGLMFNEQTSSCDYPSMVNCKGKEVSRKLCYYELSSLPNAGSPIKMKATNWF